MARKTFGIDVRGADAVKRAFDTLEPKLAKKVIRQAERKAARKFADAIERDAPVKTGRLKSTIKVRSSKGPRTAARGTISIVAIVGETGREGDKAAGIRRAFYTFMQEKGWVVGRRIRTGGKVVGYQPAVGRFGSKGVHRVPGKFFVKRALKSVEPSAREGLIADILAGIESIASKGSA